MNINIAVLEIKALLGATAENYTDLQIQICFKQAIAEIKAYCNCDIDDTLFLMAERIAIIKLNRLNSEGVNSQSYSGVSESYIDGYPNDIIKVLNRKRKVKVL